jgi:hypothetical protein
MRPYFFVFAFVIQICVSLSASAWGREGHFMTADIAEKHLTKPTKDSLKFYLGSMTLEQASTWMDDIRKDSTMDYLKPFHYINIERGGHYDPTSEGNIISELNKVVAELKDRSHHTKQEIAMDIKILIHLMGDLHQPLHVGYGEDKGGNTIKLTVLGDSSNLHRVWDTEIIKREHITTATLEEFMAKNNVGNTTDMNFVEWMSEERKELKSVYDFHGNIDQHYLDKNVALVEKQLARSGLRMATLLNSLFN